jgi:hypothetical protein
VSTEYYDPEDRKYSVKVYPRCDYIYSEDYISFRHVLKDKNQVKS